MNTRTSFGISLLMAGTFALGGCSMLPNLLEVGLGDTHSPAATRKSTGSLVVSLGTGRSVQAIAADVDHVNITVEDSFGQIQDQTVTAKQIAAGQAQVGFDSLAPGTASIDAQAVGSNQDVLGGAAGQAAVAPGQEASLSLNIDLVPDYVQGGGLQANLQLTNGPTVVLPANPAAPVLPVQVVSQQEWGPYGIALDNAQHALYVANMGGGFVDKIALAPDGTAQTSVYSTGEHALMGLTITKDGTVWATRQIDHGSPKGDVPGTEIYEISPQGAVTAVEALTGDADYPGFSSPAGMTVDDQGRLYVSNSAGWHGYVLRFDPAAVTASGSGSATVQAQMVVPPTAGLVLPNEMAWDPSGNLAIADSSGPMREMDKSGNLSVFCNTRADGIAIDPMGNVILSSYWGEQHGYVYSPSGVLLAEPQLANPVDGSGYLRPSQLTFDRQQDLYASAQTPSGISMVVKVANFDVLSLLNPQH